MNKPIKLTVLTALTLTMGCANFQEHMRGLGEAMSQSVADGQAHQRQLELRRAGAPVVVQQQSVEVNIQNQTPERTQWYLPR